MESISLVCAVRSTGTSKLTICTIPFVLIAVKRCGGYLSTAMIGGVLNAGCSFAGRLKS
jgi:hypothetical protein